jgi:hypothetical protein
METSLKVGGIISILQMKNTEVEAAKIVCPRLHRAWQSELRVKSGASLSKVAPFPPSYTLLLSNEVYLEVGKEMGYFQGGRGVVSSLGQHGNGSTGLRNDSPPWDFCQDPRSLWIASVPFCGGSWAGLSLGKHPLSLLDGRGNCLRDDLSSVWLEQSASKAVQKSPEASPTWCLSLAQCDLRVALPSTPACLCLQSCHFTQAAIRREP